MHARVTLRVFHELLQGGGRTLISAKTGKSIREGASRRKSIKRVQHPSRIRIMVDHRREQYRGNERDDRVWFDSEDAYGRSSYPGGAPCEEIAPSSHAKSYAELYARVRSWEKRAKWCARCSRTIDERSSTPADAIAGLEVCRAAWKVAAFWAAGWNVQTEIRKRFQKRNREARSGGIWARSIFVESTDQPIW